MMRRLLVHGQQHVRADARLRRDGGSAADWLKENDEATLLYAGDELISLEPQMFVELEVTHTEPGFKGDTATNTLKPATLETGKEVQVPTFIEIGDVLLQIDTRDGRVIKRV